MGEFFVKEQEVVEKRENKGYVVITGCDTGIGYNLAINMLDKGYSLIISYLENNPFSTNDDVHAKSWIYANRKTSMVFVRTCKIFVRNKIQN